MRLLEVMLEGLLQLVVVRRLRHLRQRHDQLGLGAVQILELLLQNVVERLEPHVLSFFDSDFASGSAPVEPQTGEARLRCRGARRDAHHPGQPHRERGRDPDHRRDDPRPRPPAAGVDVVRPGLPQHRLDPQRDHVHRRRRRHPALPRLPDRAARRARELPRDGVAPVRGRAADARRARRVGGGSAAPYVRAHERDAVPRRLPPRRAPDGDAARRRRRALDLLSRREGDRRRGEPPPAARAADREVPHHRRLGVPAQPRAAVRLPAQRPRLHRQLRQHDVRDRRDPRAESRPAAGARDPPHPARRPRAERLDERGARRRLDAGRPLLGRVGRGRGAVRAAARRRERGGAADARRDRRRARTSRPSSRA